MKVTYAGGVTEVFLGDKVTCRHFLFWKREGQIAYVPGISERHSQLEFNGLSWVVIRTGKTLVIPVVDPNTYALKKSICFIQRGKLDDTLLITPDFEIDDEE